jgi:NAD(P)-dependent dehydrogenase (short-subunit alcohol dehydrogenase family)
MSKTLLLTGCTRGCGQALARWLAEQGHTVLGCGRSASGVTALQKELGEPHSIEVVDVADNEATARWARHVLENYGPPDFLLNNAAIIHPNAPLWEIPAVAFDDVIDINIKGTANVLRHFLPAMVARKKGIIVNFSSGWGRSTSPEVSGYCASKWAIEGLSQSLAQELPAGMAAVALNPGIIDTDMLRSCFTGPTSAYPGPEIWAEHAGPFILRLGSKDNGKALSVTGVPL